MVRKDKLSNVIERKKYRWLKLLTILAIAYLLSGIWLYLRQEQLFYREHYSIWGGTSTPLSIGKFLFIRD